MTWLTIAAPDAGMKRKRRGEKGPESESATDTPDGKRQRRANGEADDDDDDENDDEDETDTPAGPGRLLSEEVREAIAIVLAQ
jgi:hypothetical protein